ncbi:MAG: tetratricopeptide repeat protein [Pseudomonadota bacterium]
MSIDIALAERPSGAGDAALARYDEALAGFQCFVGDPIAALKAATDDSPAFVMAHVLNAYLHLTGTDRDGVPVALAAWTAASTAPMNAREAGHMAAVEQMLGGNLRAAARILEDVAIAHPRDALALQTGQLIDFLLGDSRMLRDRIGRALPHWDPTMPGYHCIQGMLAFGLEETGLYDRAEAAGRKAIALEPRNGWAQHAVAHVFEMQDRREDGIAWMREDVDRWTNESFFAVHNWWHLALFHLGLGQTAEALELYDGPLWGHRSGLAFDMVDASALLWRLQLQGVDVGDRWTALAESWQAATGGESQYAFNDAHAAMAYVGAGRADALAALAASQARAIAGPGDNALFVGEVGRPVVDGLAAFGREDWRGAIEALRPVRNRAGRFGGSHAQRDVIDLTLIEAARRGGDRALADALLAERDAARPLGPRAG